MAAVILHIELFLQHQTDGLAIERREASDLDGVAVFVLDAFRLRLQALDTSHRHHGVQDLVPVQILAAGIESPDGQVVGLLAVLVLEGKFDPLSSLSAGNRLGHRDLSDVLASLVNVTIRVGLVGGFVVDSFCVEQPHRGLGGVAAVVAGGEQVLAVLLR